MSAVDQRGLPSKKRQQRLQRKILLHIALAIDRRQQRVEVRVAVRHDAKPLHRDELRPAKASRPGELGRRDSPRPARIRARAEKMRRNPAPAPRLPFGRNVRRRATARMGSSVSETVIVSRPPRPRRDALQHRIDQAEMKRCRRAQAHRRRAPPAPRRRQRPRRPPAGGRGSTHEFRLEPDRNLDVVVDQQAVIRVARIGEGGGQGGQVGKVPPSCPRLSNAPPARSRPTPRSQAPSRLRPTQRQGPGNPAAKRRDRRCARCAAHSAGWRHCLRIGSAIGRQQIGDAGQSLQPVEQRRQRSGADRPAVRRRPGMWQ